jgi:hypothetical protein
MRVSQMKRSCIEVDYRQLTLATKDEEDPLKLFAYMLREKYGGTEETEEYNKILLNNLLQKGQIAKSSIIWQQDKITKLYGFKVDNSGKIEYDINGNHSPEKKKTYVTNANKVDLSALKDAIFLTKQTSM